MTNASIDFNAHDWGLGSIRFSASFSTDEPWHIAATAGFHSAREAVDWALYNINTCRKCSDASVHWYGGCECECHGGMFLRGVLVQAERISQ